ncbi:MAG: pyridoxamine 5'-phosphate oxidase family protein [Proteobacteria bacterium]|nr:pyridoxamine 5'-phosphate oxidase family protein [Pseudomonadota bacterium]MDA1059868.1 pyridoxamine 5'-phosphate oxidase family protein [Pseudomonadota bacterium]
MTIATEAALRTVIGDAHPITVDKEMDHLDQHARHFIALSPFLCLGTTNGQGLADVSPRGDPPGFVAVLDDRTLLLPERPGNRRADSMLNVMANPVVGLIFFVPGIEETLRVSGRATVIDDATLLADMAVNGKPPKLAVRVNVERVFFHCAKALKRSRLWDPDARVARDAFPTPGQVIRDQRRPDLSAEELDALVIEDQTTNLY